MQRNNSHHNQYTTTTSSGGGSAEPPPRQSYFRLLCHVSMSGGVIGKSGSIVKLIEQETGAKIRFDDIFPTCEERVVHVVSPQIPTKTIALKREGEVEVKEEERREKHEVSAAQHALVRVFERVLEVEADIGGRGGGGGGGVYPKVSQCRLLAPRSSIGFLIGKEGKRMEKIKVMSGANVRVLNGKVLPVCALPQDEMIQITGDTLAIKIAIIAVSRCLQDVTQDNAEMVGSRARVAASLGTFTDPRLTPQSHLVPPPQSTSWTNSGEYAWQGHPVASVVDMPLAFDPKRMRQEVLFRLIATQDKIGGIIGKGGVIVKSLQKETGASIQTGESVNESDDRVITISALEDIQSRYSPAQNAVVRVFTKFTEKDLEPGSSVTARLMVTMDQVGCLIGRKGSIISEMRRATATGMWILTGDKLPKCASENDQVIEITGHFGNVQNALFNVTSRLRDSLLGMPRAAGAGNHFSPTIPQSNFRGKARKTTSTGFHHPKGPSHSRAPQKATLTNSMDHLQISNGLEPQPSHTPQITRMTDGAEPIGDINTRRGSATLKSSIDLSNESISMEIPIPEHAMGSVYGENESNLRRLREISGAKVEVHEPSPGTSEGMVIISGTPDQAKIAQILLRAFIHSGQSTDS